MQQAIPTKISRNSRDFRGDRQPPSVDVDRTSGTIAGRRSGEQGTRSLGTDVLGSGPSQRYSGAPGSDSRQLFGHRSGRWRHLADLHSMQDRAELEAVRDIRFCRNFHVEAACTFTHATRQVENLLQLFLRTRLGSGSWAAVQKTFSCLLLGKQIATLCNIALISSILTCLESGDLFLFIR